MSIWEQSGLYQIVSAISRSCTWHMYVHVLCFCLAAVSIACGYHLMIIYLDLIQEILMGRRLAMLPCKILFLFFI